MLYFKVMESLDDQQWMRRSIAEARKGVGLTAPNPPVGSVVVKEGVLLGCGWHQKAGNPHAEREAMTNARAKHGDDCCAGATVYVTLEPCSTTGRTPPCCDGLIDAGVKRVVWGAMDPNPAHLGAAEKVLGRAGIATAHGVLLAECRELIKGFSSAQTRERPWVIAKSAMSLDGRITRPKGEGQWLTGNDARSAVQNLRTEVDAIITSGATLRTDDPELTLRINHPQGDKDALWRVVVTRGGLLPSRAKLFTDEHRARTIIFLVGPVDGAALHAAEQLVLAENLIVTETLEGGLKALAKRGIHIALVEAGGRFLGQWLDHQLIDEFVGFYAPIICGGGALATAGVGVSDAIQMPRLENVHFAVYDDDVMLRGTVYYQEPMPGDMPPLRPCVFFDRDGVVNDPRDNYYVTSWSQFHFNKGIADVIRNVKLAGCLAILVTSQRGVGKGVMTRDALDEIHAKMQETLAVHGAAFDAIYAYCGEENDTARAKPQPDMIYQAVAEHGVDLHRSLIVGDADRDIEMGRNAGIPTVRLIAEKPVGVQADKTVKSIRELGEVLDEMCQFR